MYSCSRNDDVIDGLVDHLWLCPRQRPLYLRDGEQVSSLVFISFFVEVVESFLIRKKLKNFIIPNQKSHDGV